MKTWKHGIIGIFAIIAFAFFACDDKSDTHTHDWQWEITTPATAEDDGLETETCSICGETRGTRVIPKTGGGPIPDFVGIEGLTMDNYPRVDGSTSTNPLNVIIAANLLGLEYEWMTQDYLRDVTFTNSKDLPDTFRNKIKCSQTNGAIINLIDGGTDLIIVARKMSADEKQHAHSAGIELIETPIALDALDFIINAQNTVNSLTVKQIQDIYLGNITNWSQAGGADGEIKPFIRNVNSGSQEMMNEIVMKNTGMPDWAVSYTDEMRIGSMMLVYLELLQPNRICFTPHYYKEYMVVSTGLIADNVRTLAVNGITPDSNSIKNRSYPFVADVYVSIRSDLDHNSMAYKLYEWLRTGSGKSVIRESGYVPN
jgi:phosphate transport system substrate-binding protein